MDKQDEVSPILICFFSTGDRALRREDSELVSAAGCLALFGEEDVPENALLIAADPFSDWVSVLQGPQVLARLLSVEGALAYAQGRIKRVSGGDLWRRDPVQAIYEG